MLPHRTAGVASPLQSGATLDARPGLDDLPDDLPREVGTDGSPGMRGAGRLRATRSVVPASRRGRRRAGPPGSLPRFRTATDRPCFDDRSWRRVLLSRTCSRRRSAGVFRTVYAGDGSLHGQYMPRGSARNPRMRPGASFRPSRTRPGPWRTATHRQDRSATGEHNPGRTIRRSPGHDGCAPVRASAPSCTLAVEIIPIRRHPAPGTWLDRRRGP